MVIRNYFYVAGYCSILMSQGAHAQDKIPITFGKVTPRDFAMSAVGLDSSANALVVADFGISTGFLGARGGLVLEFHRSTRTLILKRNGFDAATIMIPLYMSASNAEKINGLRASTYNLENGKVVETKLDGKSIFTDKVGENLIEEKFTFPALKEGSILEYSYTVSSPFSFNLHPWTFQGKYPCLWSEYQVDIPQPLNYVVLSQGYLPYKISTVNNDGRTKSYRWMISNIPPLKEEPYTTTLDNYVSKVEFQISGIQFPNGIYKDMLSNWGSVNENLMDNDEFGAGLDSRNSWLHDDLKAITKGAGNELERAQKIYAFVRDSFSCSSPNGVMLNHPLKTVYRDRNGSAADLNLLLTAMMIHERIAANPVILSTRSHGFASEFFPQLDRFNYVISKIVVDSSVYYLDASEPWQAFGRLPERCYNGYARVVNKETPSIAVLSADSIIEASKTLALISNDEKGSLLVHFQCNPGYNEALELRHNVKEHGEQEFLHKLQTSYSGDATVSNLELDSLQLPDQPLEVAYDLRLKPHAGADLYYFNPMLGQGYSENPFKSAERFYPVEMPYAMDKVYIMRMDIPDGYVVDEMPKPSRAVLNNDGGFFEYVISRDDQQIQLLSRIRLMKANYKPEDYAALRSFFTYVVSKQSEQIVFKKKK